MRIDSVMTRSPVQRPGAWDRKKLARTVARTEDRKRTGSRFNRGATDSRAEYYDEEWEPRLSSWLRPGGLANGMPSSVRAATLGRVLDANTDWGDQAAHAACQAFAHCATDAVVAAGQALYVLPLEDAVRGLALVTKMGGALAMGTCDLLDARNAYGAAALLRQVVEVEYLWWTFADEVKDAALWANADRAELARRFRPVETRRRSEGRFRIGEYQAHCDKGGHPNPAGWFLVGDDVKPDPVRMLWLDLCQHLERGWGLLSIASAAVGRAGAVERDAPAVREACRDWYARDVRAARMRED